MKKKRQTPRRQSRSCTRPRRAPYPQLGTSEPFLVPVLSACTVICSYDNFHVALLDAYQRYQELSTGAIAVFICVPYMLVTLYEFLLGLPRVLTFLRIMFPDLSTRHDNIRIYGDTAIVVIISYVLLLDINLSYLWLIIFPVIAIVFIYALRKEMLADSAASSSSITSTTGGTDNDDTATKGSEKALRAMAAVPFFALLVMAQLNDHVAARFVISQFLLFLSTTLGALTYMVTRLPAGISPGIALASLLLHRTSLLLLVMTAHTVAAESLGEDVVLTCMPEVIPVLLWFSIHLDRDHPIITVDKVKSHRNVLLVLGAVVIAPLLAYLAISMDEPWLSLCTAILVSCGVSGLLTYHIVFMLRQWPGQQAAGNEDAATDTSLHPTKQPGKGKGNIASLDETVHSQGQTGTSGEALQLLKYWADALLIAAVVLLALNSMVAVRLGLHKQLVATLDKNFKDYSYKYRLTSLI